MVVKSIRKVSHVIRARMLYCRSQGSTSLSPRRVLNVVSKSTESLHYALKIQQLFRSICVYNNSSRLSTKKLLVFYKQRKNCSVELSNTRELFILNSFENQLSFLLKPQLLLKVQCSFIKNPRACNLVVLLKATHLSGLS